MPAPTPAQVEIAPNQPESKAGSANRLQAEFELTLGDVLAFYDDALRRSPSFRRKVRRFTLLSPLLVAAMGLLLFLAMGYGFPPDPIRLGFIGLAAVLAVMLMPASVQRAQLKQIRRMFEQDDRKRKYLGPTRVELQSDGLLSVSPLGTSVVAWSAVRDVVTARDHCFVHLGEWTGLIVPRRAFPGDAAFDEFSEAVRRRPRPT